MASFKYKLPEDLLKKLSTMGDKMDSIAEDVLQVGGEVVLNEVKTNLKASIGKGKSNRSTGELLSALGKTTVLVDRNGDYNIKVGFDGPRSDGSSNAKIANILEYGKHNQPARPFMKPAKTKSQKECVDKMSKKLKEEVGV